MAAVHLVRVPEHALRAQVRPKPGRAVLMDQDLLHRVSAPSPAAGGRPRYSLGAPLPKLHGRPEKISMKESLPCKTMEEL